MTDRGLGGCLPRVPPKRKAPTPRATDSGLADKLEKFFAEAKKRWRRREPGSGDVPRNAHLLHAWIDRDEPCGYQTVRGWVNGISLPESRFVPLLEELFAAPWAYIDRADTPWPPSPEDHRAFIDAIWRSVSPSRRERLAVALRRVGTERRG